MTAVDTKIESLAKDSPCLCYNIRKASRAITQIYDEMFRPYSITASQALILSSCKHLGPVTVTQMAQAMSTDRTTITRNLQVLERNGQIKIQKGRDRRARVITLTSKGIVTVQRISIVWEKFQNNLHQQVGKSHVEALYKNLSTVVAAIQN